MDPLSTSIYLQAFYVSSGVLACWRKATKYRLRLFKPWRRSWCQALDTAIVAPATRSTTPSNIGSRLKEAPLRPRALPQVTPVHESPRPTEMPLEPRQRRHRGRHGLEALPRNGSAQGCFVPVAPKRMATVGGLFEALCIKTLDDRYA